MDEKSLIEMAADGDTDDLVAKTFRKAMRALLDKCERDAERYAKEMVSPVTAELEDDLTIAVYLRGAWGEVTDIKIPAEPLRDIILSACGSYQGRPFRERLDALIGQLELLIKDLKTLETYPRQGVDL